MKTYIQPNTQVTSVALFTLICESPINMHINTESSGSGSGMAPQRLGDSYSSLKYLI